MSRSTTSRQLSLDSDLHEPFASCQPFHKAFSREWKCAIKLHNAGNDVCGTVRWARKAIMSDCVTPSISLAGIIFAWNGDADSSFVIQQNEDNLKSTLLISKDHHVRRSEYCG